MSQKALCAPRSPDKNQGSSGRTQHDIKSSKRVLVRLVGLISRINEENARVCMFVSYQGPRSQSAILISVKNRPWNNKVEQICLDLMCEIAEMRKPSCDPADLSYVHKFSMWWSNSILVKSRNGTRTAKVRFLTPNLILNLRNWIHIFQVTLEFVRILNISFVTIITVTKWKLLKSIAHSK